MKNLAFTISGLPLLFSFFVISHTHIQPEQSAPVASTVLMQTTTSWDGEQIHYPEGKAQVTALKIEIEPGAETGWHLHPVPSFAYVLQGSLEITLGDGRIHQIHEGEAVAEVFNTEHIGRNKGDETVILVVFYTGAEGKDLTKMIEEQSYK